LAGVLSQFGRSVVAAQNIVVVQSELGSAPAVARALDRLEHPRIIGTIAGDDTCLAVAGTNRDAALLARELVALVG
jgi:transcriptional regulator of arginine metabolism